MIKAEEFKKYLDFAYNAYQENNVSGQEYRQKGRVPYMLHPMWCATMIIADTDIPYEQREIGFKALLLHDVLEDTSLQLPDWVDADVQKAVRALTFESWEKALEIIPTLNEFHKLLLIYDSLSSMYENHVSDAHKADWKRFTAKLLSEIERAYGNIRIVQIGKAILENTNW